MHRKDAIAWVVSVCSVSLRLSQAKTLSILVAAAMRVQRVSLANIGRMMDGCVKHQNQAVLAVLRQPAGRDSRRHARHRRSTAQEAG